MSVIVEQYNKEWPQQFENIKSELEHHLQDIDYLSVEHVGSTSVPGLVAKPIIDVDIIVTRDNVQPAIDALIEKGKFDYLGELGIVDRHSFKDPNQSNRHNVYLCVDGVAQTRNHLSLRDTLRSDSELRDEYARVKLELAAKANNIVDYMVAKGNVIQKILKPQPLRQLPTPLIPRITLNLHLQLPLVLQSFLQGIDESCHGFCSVTLALH